MQLEIINEFTNRFDNLPDRPEKPTSQEIADIITPKPQGVVADTAWTIYSPNERQVGMWQQMVDGVLKQKPVYQKTFDGTTPTVTAGSRREVIYGTIQNFDCLVEINGYIGRKTNGYHWDVPIVFKNNYDAANNTNYTETQIKIGDSDNTAQIYGTLASAEYSEQPYRITVGYTKTTDTWQTVE